MAKRQNHRRDKRAAQRSVLEMARGGAPEDDGGGVAGLMASSLGSLPWAQLIGGAAPPAGSSAAAEDERMFDALMMMEAGGVPPDEAPSMPLRGAAPTEGDEILMFLRSVMGGGSRRK